LISAAPVHDPSVDPDSELLDRRRNIVALYSARLRGEFDATFGRVRDAGIAYGD
jgi:hypothetical protein